MSVVGPRAAWTAEEQLLQDEIQTWQKRWFVKPGLTGLAQINNASSETPRAKLQYDLTYIKTNHSGSIRRSSFDSFGWYSLT